MYPKMQKLLLSLSLLLVSSPVFAAGSNMPWEQPIQQGLDSLQGPVAKSIAAGIIIVTGLAWPSAKRLAECAARCKSSSASRFAFSASSFFMTFFSFGGGALIP